MTEQDLCQRRCSIKNIRTFVSACKLRENLGDLLRRYNVDELSDLSCDQAAELAKWLEHAHRAMTTEPTTQVRRLRSKVLVLLGKLGVGTGNNWPHINAYLLQPMICGKLLYMLDVDELRALECKLYGIVEKQKKKAMRETKPATEPQPPGQPTPQVNIRIPVISDTLPS